MINLPSLTGLRAFEAAARCGSFVLAGQELGVSSAAVSLQIKNLEEHLEKKLFVRKGNRIYLTDAGEMMYPRLARAFGELSDAARLVRNERHSRQLVISVLPALADLWFLPRATAFREKTGIALDIRVEDDPVDFEREAIDVRLTYRSALYAGYHHQTLFSDVAVPVCTPAFRDQHAGVDGTLNTIPDAYLIHIRWGPGYASEPLWQEWRRVAGCSEADLSDAGLCTNDISLAISLARRGAGIALVPSVLAQPDIAAGALVVPSPHHLPMKKDYVCVLSNARLESPMVRSFLTVLASG
ncbi:LysR substrate-binding domain-containing protein [Coralliovum pocilloporae]|uniref:LysR substrate-binding domain-containing protein n=1 Tax=Coralliovum pocilloporae TaxID=3066369 RepID=UPI003306D192